jgi:NLI interacting factor-like phosphatase
VSSKVLALDLEHTLIDDALSGRPRPGLLDFLAFCHSRFRRVALFTTVEEAVAREVMGELEHAGHLPPDILARLEYVAWGGEYKDLGFVRDAAPSEVLLVDDDGGWVRPDQRGQWVPVAAWYGGPDEELRRVQLVLEGWLGGDNGPDAEQAPAAQRPPHLPGARKGREPTSFAGVGARSR